MTTPVRVAGLFVFAVSTRLKRIGLEHLDQGGPLLLVCNHLCHNDPLLLSIATPRRMEWMARVESEHTPWSAAMLALFDAFTVDRFGYPRAGLREGLRRLGAQRNVGVFPEGGVMSGETSVLNGAAIKRGAFWLSQRSGVPVVPCVMLGSRGYMGVMPWLPFKASRLWVAYGAPIAPSTTAASSAEDRKADRSAMAAHAEQAMQGLYRELLERFEVSERARNV